MNASQKSQLFLIFVVLANPAASQSVSTLMGARAAGMGYASATISDPWSLLNNPGGLAAVERPATAFACEATVLPGANRNAALLCAPLSTGVAGFALFRFGDEVYHEEVATAGYSHRLGIASLGITMNYIQYTSAGFGRRSAVSLNFGGVAQITPQILVGAYVININQPKLATQGPERLPTKMSAGISFKPAGHILVAIEIAKDLDYDAVVKGGIEYKVLQKVSFRTGFNLRPGIAFFGLGFASRNIRFDYAFQYASVLGGAHQASAVYQFRKSKNHSR